MERDDDAPALPRSALDRVAGSQLDPVVAALRSVLARPREADAAAPRQ